MADKKTIKKENWVSSFDLVGVAKVNEYSFKIDQQSEKSSWIYNALNLGVDCGEKHGVIYCEMMGGYSDEKENTLYKHETKDGGGYAQKLVDWDDRFDEEVLEKIPNFDFIRVGLEKTTTDGKPYIKKFLSEYDAIAYINDHLVDGMTINVRGRLKYTLYQDNVQVRKEIQSIILTNSDDHYAHFMQSVLIDKDSASLKNIDKNKSVMYVDARVLDYIKEYNGLEIKGQYPLSKQFEYEMDFTNQDKCKKIIDSLFKVKKDITQITFNGDLIESGAVVKPTIDDLTDEIRGYLDSGVYTEQQALDQCSAPGGRERRMVLCYPHIRMVGDTGNEQPVVQIFKEQYTEDDLAIDYSSANKKVDEKAPSDEDDATDSDDGDASDLDWLNDL